MLSVIDASGAAVGPYLGTIAPVGAIGAGPFNVYVSGRVWQVTLTGQFRPLATFWDFYYESTDCSGPAFGNVPSSGGNGSWMAGATATMPSSTLAYDLSRTTLITTRSRQYVGGGTPTACTSTSPSPLFTVRLDHPVPLPPAVPGNVTVGLAAAS